MAATAVRHYVECLTNKQTHRHTANLTPNVLDTIYQGNRMVLYKQRFLLTLIPLITPFIKSSANLPGDVSVSLVQAVGTLLQCLPQTLVSTHGDTLYPILVKNLTPSLCDTALLHLIQHLISTSPGVVIMHLDTLIARLGTLSAAGGGHCDPAQTRGASSSGVSRCDNGVSSGCSKEVGAVAKETISLPSDIALTSNTSSNTSTSECSVRVRVEALITLRLCTSQLHHKHTHIHRDSVLKSLRNVLRDRKRVVRQAAAETVQSWTMLRLS